MSCIPCGRILSHTMVRYTHVFGTSFNLTLIINNLHWFPIQIYLWSLNFVIILVDIIGGLGFSLNQIGISLTVVGVLMLPVSLLAFPLVSTY